MEEIWKKIEEYPNATHRVKLALQVIQLAPNLTKNDILIYNCGKIWKVTLGEFDENQWFQVQDGFSTLCSITNTTKATEIVDISDVLFTCKDCEKKVAADLFKDCACGRMIHINCENLEKPDFCTKCPDCKKHLYVPLTNLKKLHM